MCLVWVYSHFPIPLFHRKVKSQILWMWVSGVGVFPLPHSPFSQKGKISDSMDVGGMGGLYIFQDSI